MDKTTEIQDLKILLLGILPQWNYRISKPFKQLLDEGVSLEMYYCLQILRILGGTATMSEMGNWMKIPKQQMTKLVNRLVEHHFVERIYDESDRRIINVKITDVAIEYINYFLTENANCFGELLEQMSDRDRAKFKKALEMMGEVFVRLSYEDM